jgi:hypothetical protein
MSDRVKLAREIAAHSKPRFIDTTARTKDLKALAREIAARTPPRFVSIPRERRSKVPFTEEQLAAMRGGLRRGISLEDNPKLGQAAQQITAELICLSSAETCDVARLHMKQKRNAPKPH